MKKNYICPDFVVLRIEQTDMIRTSNGLTLSDNQNVHRDGANFDDLFGNK